MKNAYPGNPHPYRLRQYSGDSTNTVSDMDWVDDGYNIKMDLYIKAALLAYVGPPSLLETYQNNTDHDIPLEVNITNPFRNWRNFTVKVAVVAPNSTEETILEEELKLDHGESRTLDLSYSTEKGAIGGDYYVIAGIYLSGMNRNGSLVMVDKWGDTVGELCTSKFTLLNATPIVDVELVENTEWEQDPDKLHIYYIMCEDSPGLELAPKSTLTYRNEIRDKLDSFALASGVELVHRDITDTRELLELVGSDISDSMVINMHGGVLPIPHTFVKGDDPFEDTAGTIK